MLKKVISVSLIMLFLFVSFAGVFANGHKHGNGEFIEEEVITQEYVAGVEGVEAVDEVIGYTVNYSVTPNPTATANGWTYDVKFSDEEIAVNTESDPFENDIPDIYVEATRGDNAYTIYMTENLQEGDNKVILDKYSNEGIEFNGLASFEVDVKVTKVIITKAEEAKKAEDEIVGVKEIYITGYKITSGKYAGYSVMFAEKVLKCTIKFKIVDGKEQVIDTKYTKEWHKLKCLEFGIYVKKTCKWGNGKHLFEYNKWMHKGKYIKVENEESVIVEESVTGNQESTTVEKESTTSNEESGKRKDTMISIENNDYDSNGSSNGLSGSNYSSDSSSSDDTTAVNHTVTSNGLPKTGESASANIIFYCIGGLLLMIAGIILFRNKVINKFME